MSTVISRARIAAGLLGVLFTMGALHASVANAAPSFEVNMTNDIDDIQAVYVEATTGTFRLDYAPPGAPTGPGLSETVDISATATATAAEVESALNALANISEDGGSVSVRKVTIADGMGTTPYLVTFDGGPLRMTLQPLMTALGGSVPLADSPLDGGVATAFVTTRAPGGLSRSDERMNFTIRAKNTAPAVVGNPVVGDTLGCNGAKPNKSWTPAALANRPSSFGFEWRRNGVLIAGEDGASYVATADDDGAVIQCLVTGTSANGLSAAKYASLPGATIDPQPTTAPPAATTPTAASSRPTITGTSPRTCTAPTGFSGAPTWTFQWLRNGDPIPGANINATATTSQYTPVEADTGTRLQCEVIGTNAGGSLVTVSEGVSIGTVANPPVLAVAQTPNLIINATNPVVELELPAGQQSHLVAVSIPSVVQANNYWTCKEIAAVGLQPASVACSNPNVIVPGGEVPPIEIGVGLGSDAPAVSEVIGRISGTGVQVPAVTADEIAFGPFREFGIIPGRFSAEALDEKAKDYVQAGGHPSLAATSMSFNRNRGLTASLPYEKFRPAGPLRNAMADIPPGFIGNPLAVPELCPTTEDMLAEPVPTCPPGSVVGELAFAASGFGTPDGQTFKRMALYAMEPEAGAPAQFGAAESVNKGVYVLTPRLRPSDGYAISIDALGIVEVPKFTDVRVTLCGFGSNTTAAGGFRSCKEKGDEGAFEKPFLTSQTECAASGPVTTINVDSWADPGDVRTATAIAPKMTGCEAVPFQPKLNLKPTSNQAESASGLDVDLTVPTEGLEKADECHEEQGNEASPLAPQCLSQAHLKKTTVTLPKGMSLNPSAADGLAACTQAQLGMVNGVPNNNPVQCPDASKIGTAVAKTPILEETLEGGIYLAKQGDNPFGTLAAIYVVVESKERGVLIKLPGRVDILPGGQIVSTFDDNPQAPVSSLELDFNSGPRAALMMPQRCGSYSIVSQLTPWSAADPDNPTAAETVTETSNFVVDSGPGGGACPTGQLLPTMKAGLTNPLAAASSPFVVSLSRSDGTQRFNGLSMTLPKGLTASLRGVPYCPDAVLSSIPSAEGTGAAEIENPSCSSASQVGTVSVGAGAGNPYYVNTGKAYLAGPYKGAPLSLAVVIPAVAGPFDLGNVVVRNALYVDPATAQITVKSDPLPTQLHNLPVDVRDVRVSIDRDGFTRAPTSCEVMSIDAIVGGEEGGFAPAQNRFQVGECAALDFNPKLSLKLKGGTKRDDHPALRAVLTQPQGQANIGGVSVALPPTQFIDNDRIGNVCTRPQFNEGNCPKSSILGNATAYSPLLDEPLTGKVYFRANGGERELPDVVAELNGQVRVVLVGFVDALTKKGSESSRIRNRFVVVPDAPVSRFVLNLKGGKEGLLVNSRDICAKKFKATVRLDGQNGKLKKFQPVVANDCGKKKGKKSQKKSRSNK